MACFHHQVFSRGVSCRLRFSFQHVPSRTGLKWNDVADEDAKSLLDDEPASGLNLNLVHASLGQFTGTTPTMELADYLSGVKVKRMASLVLLDQAVPDTFQSSCRVRRKQQRQSCTRTSLTWATANVLTLNPAETRHPRAGGLGQSARSSLLQAQFSKAGVDIVGVQEARMESAQRTAALFDVWSAGAAPGGHLGCELWISVSCGIAPTEVTVAHADPRRLVCSVALSIAVLHAPVDQGEDGDFTWWDQTLSILRPVFATFRNCVVLIDANARLGSIRSSSVGACNPEPQSPNGNHFHSLLGALSLKAVNTFVDSPPTWKNHRIDYCAASFHLQVVNAGTFVEVDLATTEREDHRPVFAEIVLSVRASSIPATSSRIRLAVLPFQRPFQLKTPDFSVDVDTHYQWLCDSITKLAEVYFPLDKCKPRHPWTSSASLQIVQVRRQVREISRGDSAWTAGGFTTTPPRPGLSDWLRIFHQRQAWALHLLRHLSQQIKVSVGIDKTAYLSRMAAIANAAAENSNTKRFYWAVKRLKKFRPKPLRGVFLEDGELAKSPEEVAARWQRHFSSALAGTPVSLEDISRGHFARTSAPGCTPTQTQLRALLLKSSKAKAPGPDGIVNEVLVAGGDSIVRELQRVFFKVCLSNSPPHAMRGGWLVDIFKGKGDPRDCSSSRGSCLRITSPSFCPSISEI